MFDCQVFGGTGWFTVATFATREEAAAFFRSNTYGLRTCRIV